MGIAEVPAHEEFSGRSSDGDGVVMPEGESKELGMIKSSRFIGSGSGLSVSSCDWRN